MSNLVDLVSPPLLLKRPHPPPRRSGATAPTAASSAHHQASKASSLYPPTQQRAPRPHNRPRLAKAVPMEMATMASLLRQNSSPQQQTYPSWIVGKDALGEIRTDEKFWMVAHRLGLSVQDFLESPPQSFLPSSTLAVGPTLASAPAQAEALEKVRVAQWNAERNRNIALVTQSLLSDNELLAHTIHQKENATRYGGYPHNQLVPKPPGNGPIHVAAPAAKGSMAASLVDRMRFAIQHNRQVMAQRQRISRQRAAEEQWTAQRSYGVKMQNEHEQQVRMDVEASQRKQTHRKVEYSQMKTLARRENQRVQLETLQQRQARLLKQKWMNALVVRQRRVARKQSEVEWKALDAAMRQKKSMDQRIDLMADRMQRTSQTISRTHTLYEKAKQQQLRMFLQRQWEAMRLREKELAAQTQASAVQKEKEAKWELKFAEQQRRLSRWQRARDRAWRGRVARRRQRRETDRVRVRIQCQLLEQQTIQMKNQQLWQTQMSSEQQQQRNARLQALWVAQMRMHHERTHRTAARARAAEAFLAAERRAQLEWKDRKTQQKQLERDRILRLAKEGRL